MLVVLPEVVSSDIYRFGFIEANVARSIIKFVSKNDGDSKWSKSTKNNWPNGGVVEGRLALGVGVSSDDIYPLSLMDERCRTYFNG